MVMIVICIDDFILFLKVPRGKTEKKNSIATNYNIIIVILLKIVTPMMMINKKYKKKLNL